MDHTLVDEIKYNHNILDLIYDRFKKNIYYTWADLVLISVNPFVDNEANSSKNERLKEYLKKEPFGKKLEPHVYSVVYRAYRCISANRKNQTVVIIGDSGSGKTYSTQKALQLLTNENRPLGDIKYSLTLLSAFGNAGTECHSDSSRFGKLLLLGYKDYTSDIVSAKLLTYLLEITRVASPTGTNFHIFYQILSTLVLSDKYKLNLKKDVVYRILPSQLSVQNSTRSLGNTLEALRLLKFDSNAVEGIITIVASILHLGNICFSSNDGQFSVDSSKHDSMMALIHASDLLGLDVVAVELLLTHTIYAPDSRKNDRSVYEVPVATLADAMVRRDALMKALYLLLFRWIVATINDNFASSTNTHASYHLGLLDIYGFEKFSRNSLEQLCINYANERLHSFFVQDFLLQKKMVLLNEGLMPANAPKVESQFFKDILNRIAALDAPISLIGIINDVSLLNRQSDSVKELCHRLSTLPKSKFMSIRICEHKFSVSHFAGTVKYDAKYLVEKNADKVPSDILNTLGASRKEFVVNLVNSTGSDETTTLTRNNTVLSKFKNSLESLLKQLKSSQIHYIRCLKPNLQMRPGVVDKQFLSKQLEASGLLEVVKLCGHCYPIRLTLNEFLEHFHKLIGTFDAHHYCSDNFKRTVIQKWMEEVNVSCQLTDQCVFIKEETFTLLEAKVQFLWSHSARVVQHQWRLYNAAKKHKAARLIQHYLKRWTMVKHKNRELMRKMISDSEVSDREQDPSDGLSLRTNDPIKVSSADMTTCQGVRKKIREGVCERSVSELGQSDAAIEKSCYSVNQNLTVAMVDVGDRVRMSAGDHITQADGKLHLVMNWLDNVPSTSAKVNFKWSGVEESSTFPSVIRQPKKQKRKYQIQSELYSIANQSYRPITNIDSCYSYHYLKQIIVTEKKLNDGSTLFVGNGVVSRRTITQIPIWFHVKKTCLNYSHVIPYTDVAQGVMDAL